MKYQAIEACKAEFPVSRLCAVLKIAQSGYYAWSSSASSPHEQANWELEQTISTVWKQYRRFTVRHASMLNYRNRGSVPDITGLLV